MEKKELNCSDHVADYAFDLMSDEERRLFESHLADCAACQDELMELRQGWSALPYLAEKVEPPAEMKQSVMSGIFVDERTRSHFHVKMKNPIWFYLTSAAVIIAIVAGTIWNIQITEQRQFAVIESLTETASIEKLVSLVAMGDAANDQTYGIACVVNKGDVRELVVYVFNADHSQGGSVYQVWLQQDGERSNAGTFRVGDKGIGVLTYAMADSTAFEAIGITLEADGKGALPRGPKVFGSMEPIQWN